MTARPRFREHRHKDNRLKTHYQRVADLAICGQLSHYVTRKLLEVTCGDCIRKLERPQKEIGK